MSKFIPQRKNANKHTQRGLKELENSIQRDGWIGAVTVAADGETFDGSARIETLANVMPDAAPIVIDVDGNTPVIVRRTDIPNADDPRAKRLAVAANRIAQVDLDWNASVLADLAQQEGDILKGLFNDDELAELIGQGETKEETADAGELVDKAAELQKKWQVQRGDVWQIGRHRLMCGDSTSAEDVARVMQGERAQAVVTDPPYGMNLNTDYSDMPETRIASKTYARVVGDDKDFDASGFIALFDYVKEQFWWGGDYYYQTLPIHGSWIVWDKRNENSDGLVGNHFELCWSRTPHRRRMIREHWSGVNARNQGMTRSHPTEKSINVLAEIIGDYTDKGAIVVDLFAGVGTVGAACERLERQSRMIEIDPRYCAVTLERMSLLGLTPKRIN